MSKKLLGLGFLHTTGVAAYVSLVALIMTKAEHWVGPQKGFLGPALILMLLTLSVAVVGSLIFVRPALWALNGQKKEAVSLVLYTLGWLAVFVIISFAILAGAEM